MGILKDGLQAFTLEPLVEIKVKIAIRLLQAVDEYINCTYLINTPRLATSFHTVVYRNILFEMSEVAAKVSLKVSLG